MSKTTALMFRVTDDEKEALEDFASKIGVSRSDVMRRLLRETLSHGPSFFPNENDGLVAVARQIAAQGRNINQITRRVNSGQCKADPFTKAELNEIKSILESERKLVRSMLDNARQRRVVLRRSARGLQND